jgi:hypothetical protein
MFQSERPSSEGYITTSRKDEILKGEEKKNIYQSHWTKLISFYNIASVTDQDEQNEILI